MELVIKTPGIAGTSAYQSPKLAMPIGLATSESSTTPAVTCVLFVVYPALTSECLDQASNVSNLHLARNLIHGTASSDSDSVRLA